MSRTLRLPSMFTTRAVFTATDAMRFWLEIATVIVVWPRGEAHARSPQAELIQSGNYREFLGSSGFGGLSLALE